MIDPAGIPIIDGNMDALAGHATAISDTGRAFADTGARIHNTWQGLYPHYIAPESGQLLSATGIIATTTASVGEDLGTAGDALTTYADEVRVIQAALVALKSQAEGLAAERTAAGDDWASDSALVERDTALIDAVNAQVAAFADAERRCANALRVLYGAPLLSVDNGDGVLDPATEHGFTAEQLDAAARNGGTPWGATSEVDHAWPIDVLHGVGSFFGGLYQSGEGAVVGIGTLLGFSGGENAGAAWGALGTLATGALVYGLVGIEEAERLDHNGSVPWLAPGAMGQSLEDAGKAFIAYDQWDDDPARAAGATLGNVILTVVGPKAVGGVTRSTGAALGRIPGPVAARTSQALINAGTTIGRTPTLTDISRYARNTFPGFRSPDLRTPPINATPDAPARRPPDDTGMPSTASDGRPSAAPSTVSVSPEPRPDLDNRPAESVAASAVDPPPASTITNPPESSGSADRPPEREPAVVGATPASAPDSHNPDAVPSNVDPDGPDGMPIVGSSDASSTTHPGSVGESAGAESRPAAADGNPNESSGGSRVAEPGRPHPNPLGNDVASRPLPDGDTRPPVIADPAESPRDSSAPERGGAVEGHPASPPPDGDTTLDGSRPAAVPGDNQPTGRAPTDGPDTRLSRQDDDFYNEINSRRGVPKSHLDENGNLVPANLDGTTTVVEHVVGRPAEVKGNSPYSSFSGPEANPKRFGDNIIYLDIDSLRADIDAGRVADVEVLPPARVQAQIQESADAIAGRHVDLTAVPSLMDELTWAESLGLGRKKTERMAQRLLDMRNTQRDVEWLIRGTIPARHLQGPYPQ